MIAYESNHVEDVLQMAAHKLEDATRKFYLKIWTTNSKSKI